MQLDSSNQYRSCLGTVLSLFTYVLILAYLSYRTSVLWDREEYKITHSLQENHFELLADFSPDDGFRVAAGIVSSVGYERLL